MPSLARLLLARRLLVTSRDDPSVGENGLGLADVPKRKRIDDVADKRRAAENQAERVQEVSMCFGPVEPEQTACDDEAEDGASSPAEPGSTKCQLVVYDTIALQTPQQSR